MSTEIYYFSGTGNSLHVAQELQKRLPGARLIPIMSLAGTASVGTSADTIGFVFPHYASSLPRYHHPAIRAKEIAAQKTRMA